jgi:hypothetical protein
VAVAAPVPSLEAQSTCRPSPSSAESRLLRWFSLPLGFHAAMAPEALAPGQLVVALELAAVPQPGADVRRAEDCFVEKGQNTGLSPVLPRPRLAIGLPLDLAVELSYLPPVTVADATPSLLGVALSRALLARGPSHVQLRAHATLGSVEGPVTCARGALQPDPLQPCFGAEPSNDRFAPNVYGLELLGARRVGVAWRMSAGLGAAHLRPRFQVGFRNGFGVLDATRVVGEYTRATGVIGADRALGARGTVGLLASGMAGDAFTVRVTGQWRLR